MTASSPWKCATKEFGAATLAGHGLVGISDRIDALAGRLRIQSAAGGGTALAARLPMWGPGSRDRKRFARRAFGVTS
jgi:glucose-6-phosphate-specific signal transduction histidine kinase